MKILLTGAKGQVGQELIERAEAFSCELLAFSKADLDITVSAQIEEAVEAQKPDLIINAAAYTAVDKAEQEFAAALAVNRDGVRNLAQVCKHKDLPLIHISTDYVFDGSKASAYVEDDQPLPLNAYGRSKAEGELALQREWDKHLIVRTSWVFGKYGPNFVKTILKLALKQKELRIVVDQQGCPTAAGDLAVVLLKLARQISQGRPHWGIFHYCGDRPTNWFEFAHRIVSYGEKWFPLQVEKLSPITTAAYPTPAKRPKNSILNMEKIKNVYGATPSAWEAALEQVINHLNEKGECRAYLST